MKNLPSTTLRSYEEVDKQLFELAQIESKLAKKEAAMNEAIQKIKDKFEEQTQQEQASKQLISQNIEGFLLLHKLEFEKQRTKKLTHGVVGFRSGTPKVLLLNRKFNAKTQLEFVKKLFKTKYIRIKEELNKDAILADYSSGKLNDEKLAAFGTRIDKNEKVVIDIDWESIESEI